MKLPSIRQAYLDARTTFLRFPFVICVALLATAAALIIVDHQGPNEPTILFNIFFAGVLGIPLFLTIVLVAERRGLSRASGFGLQVIGILLLGAYATTIPTAPFQAPLVSLWRFFILAVALHLLVSVAPYTARGEWSGFWNYNKTLFLRILTALLYSHVLYAGLAIGLAALDHLFGVNVPGKRYVELWILISMMFTTWFFLAGIPENLTLLDSLTDYPKSLRVLAQYILIPIVLLYLAILYAYLTKIVIAWNWPQGWVSKLILGFTATGMFSLLLLRPIVGRSENVWVKKAEQWFYLVLIPLVVMLFLAVWRRVNEYGITEGRYLALATGVWLLFLIAYFTLSRQKSIKIIPLSLCLAAFSVSFGPWGTFSVSRHSQINRLEALATKSQILVDAKIRPPHGEIPFIQAKQMSSILDYLHEVHGYDEIQGWFSESLKLDPTSSDGAYKSPAVVAELMGIPYIAPWATSPNRIVLFEADGPFNPVGYDRMVNLQWYIKRDTMSTDGIGYALDSVNNLGFFSIKTGKELVKIDLGKHAGELLSKYGVVATRRIPSQEMAMTGSANGLNVTVYPWRMQVQQLESKTAIVSVEAVVLYSVEKQQ